MGKSIRIMRIFGIDINLHYSWFFIFILLMWSLATAFFPQIYPGATTLIYWLMGASAAILLFVSVLLHELSHSLVAKIKHIKVESITLFFFGGVAGITRENMKPSSEFLMAIAGPILSMILGGIFFAINKLNGNGIVLAITLYLYQLNFILAAFNLVPGFPLDGGRAFRAILHAYYKDLQKATRIASRVGRMFAGLLIILGIFGMFTGQGGGLWFILIGGFLYFIAGMSYQQIVVRQILIKFKIKDIMQKEYTTLNPELKFSAFLKRNSPEDAYIVKNGNFAGVLEIRNLAKVPSSMHDVIKLKQVSLPFSQIKSLNPENNGYNGYRKFSQQRLSILPVLKKGKLVGIVSSKVLQNKLILGLTKEEGIKMKKLKLKNLKLKTNKLKTPKMKKSKKTK